MLGDARTVEHGATLATDVCVIGGGAAGIALARAFSRHEVDTCLIEAGGIELDLATQSLYQGQAIGRLLPHDYLVRSRLRQLGGTTNHWGGMTLAINAHVFEPRPGVPGGEWPFPKEELDPYYREAAQFLGSKREYEPEAPTPPDAPFVEVRSYPIEHLRPGDTYRRTLAESPSVRTLLFGNVVELETDRDGRRVRSVTVATLGGNRFTVTARVFVLATGGVENARLLLQPTATRPNGLGNEHDLVGRHFMEHVFVLTGMAVRTSEEWPMFAALSPELQARHHLLDAGLHLRRLPMTPDAVSLALVPAVQALDGLEPEEGEDSEAAPLRAVLSAESLPNPENRVSLAPERDELGLHRCRVRFELGDEDRRSLQETQTIVARIVGERGWGRLLPGAIDGPMGNGSHHMGTTRMHPNPRYGVVDPNCRVHGLSNLFVAGSSVFPSAGLVNPTFTLLALTYRLAGHLLQGLRHGAFSGA